MSSEYCHSNFKLFTLSFKCRAVSRPPLKKKGKPATSMAKIGGLRTNWETPATISHPMSTSDRITTPEHDENALGGISDGDDTQERLAISQAASNKPVRYYGGGPMLKPATVSCLFLSC
jgi:hypothetical protein